MPRQGRTCEWGGGGDCGDESGAGACGMAIRGAPEVWLRGGRMCMCIGAVGPWGSGALPFLEALALKGHASAGGGNRQGPWMLGLGKCCGQGAP